MYSSVQPLAAVTAIAPFIAGLFYEWASAVLSLYLLGYLLHCRRYVGKLRFPVGSAMVFSLVTVFFFFLSPLWAADRGMALFGLIKFLPLPLFVFALGQTDPDSRGIITFLVPYAGAVMTVLSFCLRFIPSLRSFFEVNGRLAGFFQYPNSFAAYLLTGVVFLTPKLKEKPVNIAAFAVLLAGIFLSGSRTVFVLTVAAIISVFFIIMKGDRENRRIFGVCIGVIAVSGSLYAVLSGNIASLRRVLSLSLQSSTFLGRLLYFKDALPVILRHPLGLGYLGYSFMQGSFQTGVYSVLNVHNELLQSLLDVGWVPAGLAVWAVVDAFRCAAGNPVRRIALGFFCAHCLFDFDLQFIALDMLFLSMLEIDGKRQPKPEKLRLFPAFCAVTAAFCLWLGADSFLLRTGRYEEAVRLYSGCTSARMELLPAAKSAEEMDVAADEILTRNKFVSIAYSAKARAAYSRGDTENMIANKLKAIELAKYNQAEYDDFRSMLGHCITLYEASGDNGSAAKCREILDKTYDMAAEVLASTSPIAWKLNDKPELK